MTTQVKGKKWHGIAIGSKEIDRQHKAHELYQKLIFQAPDSLKDSFIYSALGGLDQKKIEHWLAVFERTQKEIQQNKDKNLLAILADDLGGIL